MHARVAKQTELYLQPLPLAEVKTAQLTGIGTRAQSSCLEMQGWHYARARALQVRTAQASRREQEHRTEKVRGAMLYSRPARGEVAAKEKVWP